MNPTTATHMIGIGSPYGDDQVGWHVISALETEPLPAGVRLVRCDAPARQLLQFVQDTRQAILIDAVHSGAAPGTIHRWTGDTLAQAQSALSSHGLDVTSTLALGKTLGVLPPQLVLYGIEIALETLTPAPDRPLSTAVAAAIPVLLEQLKCHLRPFFPTFEV